MGRGMNWDSVRRSRLEKTVEPERRNEARYSVQPEQRGKGYKWYQHPPKKERITLPKLKFMEEKPADDSK